jgi:putative photosynthetic complex assembly protein
MSNPFRDQPFPRGALLGVAALIGFALVAVAIARFTDDGRDTVSTAGAVEVRDLQFVDQPAGLVHVIDSENGERIATLEPGTENFIRGVLRGLVRERRSQGLGMEHPFRIARFPDGRLVLQDRATDRIIELQAFGPTNAGAFARLLDAPASDS